MTCSKLSLLCLALVLGTTWTVSALGANPKDALIGYWKLDGDTLDSSGLGNHGTAVGDPVFVQGLFEQAMYFDGAQDYLVIDSVADDFTDDDLTLSAWIKTEDTRTWQWWFSCNTATGGNTIILGLINGQITVHQGAVVVTSTTVVNDLQWHHVAYTRIGSVGSLYINGVLEGTHTAAFQLSADDRWSIAQEWDSGSPGDFLNGTVDDVRIYDRGLTAEELPLIMTTLPPGAAFQPVPAHESIDVPRDVVLTWKPGKYAPAVNGHRVYLSESFDEVNNGIGGITLSDNTYTPPQRLDFGTTYYWRVDEVNAPPDATVFPGEVWSFTVEPIGYALPAERILATASSSSSNDEGPENTIGGVGLNGEDRHSIDTTQMWLSGTVGPEEAAWIQYEFDKVYALHQMLIWNHNAMTEPVIGFGIRETTIEYSVDGVEWKTLDGDHTFSQATGKADYASNTTIDFGGAAARIVRITAANNWGGIIRQYGLSEVCFLNVPLSAREPQPASSAVDVEPQLTLHWRAGREAAVHEVYLSTDEQAVIDRTAPVAVVSAAAYDAGALDLDRMYYWSIDEVNEAETINVWAGDVWSFSTREHLIVEDFESYDDAENRIYETWIDGWENQTGSQVGYLDAPFAEQMIVRGGRQAMPLVYNNAGSPFYSETEHLFSAPQDWAAHGISALTIHFRGKVGNTGQLYVKINNTKVPYDGDPADLARMIWQTWNIDLSKVAGNLTSVTKLTIGIEGANASGTLYIDDIHLYRQAPVITKPVEPDRANLVAHFTLDGNAGDSAGNGHPGEATGDPTYVSGVRGQAMEFDGVDDYVRITHHDALNPGDGSFTIAFWANLDLSRGTSGATNWDLAVAKRDTGSVGYYVGADRNQGKAEQAGYKFMLGSEKRVDTPFLLVPLGEWVYVAAVLDRESNVHKISVDGGQTWANSTPPANPIVPVQDLALGWDIGPQNYWFCGAIDEVRIYNHALSDAEVAWLAAN